MPYRTRSRYRFNLESLPPGVRWLLVANVSIWLINVVCELMHLDWFYPLALTPYAVIHHFEIWQLGTYLFLHSMNPLHILFNMLGLWWAGTMLEQTWGTRRFLKFYFTCGVGAGICVVLFALLFEGMGSSTIGASGAVLGVLLAFCLLLPDTTVVFIIFPIKAFYLVIILVVLALFDLVFNRNAAHIGGLAVGYAYLRLPLMRLDGLSLNRRYERWRIERAKRKFQVYMRKQDSKREPWVH